jgi:ribonuclease PH
MAIRNTLEQTILTELLPRSQIDIYVQVSMSIHAACRPAAACRVASLP